VWDVGKTVVVHPMDPWDLNLVQNDSFGRLDLSSLNQPNELGNYNNRLALNIQMMSFLVGAGVEPLPQRGGRKERAILLHG
jgi:hypothetical protein